MDTETEANILGNLKRIMEGRTSLISVPPGLDQVRSADLILVLDQGQIVERGTHDELIALDGEYAELHQRQQRGGTGLIRSPINSSPRAS